MMAGGEIIDVVMESSPKVMVEEVKHENCDGEDSVALKLYHFSWQKNCVAQIICVNQLIYVFEFIYVEFV